MRGLLDCLCWLVSDYFEICYHFAVAVVVDVVFGSVVDEELGDSSSVSGSPQSTAPAHSPAAPSGSRPGSSLHQ